MQKIKIIRFNNKLRAQCYKDISKMQEGGPINKESNIYIGLFVNGELASGIWKHYNYISYVTKRKHRNNGYVSRLLGYIKRDVNSGAIGNIAAMPINARSIRILKRAKFISRNDCLDIYDYKRKK